MTDDRPLVDADFVDMEDLETAPYTKAQARRVTERIKLDLIGVWHLIADAYKGRIWIPLGYSNWDEYCIREFGSSRLRLPREERPEMVASLRQSGLSIRAIASATGAGVGTIHREIEAGAAARALGVPNGTPAESVDDESVDEEQIGDADQLAEELIAADQIADRTAAEPAPVIGIDGKTYRRPRKPAPTPGPTPTQGRGDTVHKFTVVRVQREPEPTPAQRRSGDNEINFYIQVRRIRGDLDALMGFAKALDPDAKRKVIDKHQEDLVDCATKLVAIHHELSEPEQEPATDQKPTDA